MILIDVASCSPKCTPEQHLKIVWQLVDSPNHRKYLAVYDRKSHKFPVAKMSSFDMKVWSCFGNFGSFDFSFFNERKVILNIEQAFIFIYLFIYFCNKKTILINTAKSLEVRYGILEFWDQTFIAHESELPEHYFQQERRDYFMGTTPCIINEACQLLLCSPSCCLIGIYAFVLKLYAFVLKHHKQDHGFVMV